jgi:acyl-CoA thioesterase FadM
MSDQKRPPVEWVVERGKIAEFARACLNESDAYTKEDAVASPTFPQTLAFWRARVNAPREEGRGGMDMRRVLHGEQEFEYLRPLRAGDELWAESYVKDEYEKAGKRGGSMRFVVTETVFKDSDGEVVAYSRGTTIVTSKATTDTTGDAQSATPSERQT